MPTKIPDLDAVLDFDPDEEVPTTTVKLFGREWNLLTGVNTYAATALGSSSADGSAFVGYIQSMVDPEQWADFNAALMKIRNLTSDKLWKIVNTMTEVIADLPTQQPTASRPGPTKRTSAPKSRATSSAARAKTSRR